MIRAAALAVLCAAALPVEGAALAAVAEPDGYRQGDYNADVPATLRGGDVVNTAQLVGMVKAGHPILIDVLPAPAPPADNRASLPRMPLPRTNIAGSRWLPDVGRGALSPALEARFRADLARLSHGDKAAALVFYCRPRCWMSWNAARRAISYGYSHVIWYPQGVAGWQQAGQPTQIAQPF
jgi:PQQ-dependent catabolism-associated CXXCW motif protein